MPAPRARQVGPLVGALVAMVALLAVSGVALALRYDAGDAHASAAQMPAWLRAAHAWAASGALVAAALLGGAAYLGGHRRVALASLVALGSLLLAFLLGRILPWDQHAWESLQHLRSGTGFSPSEDAAGAPLRALLWAHALLVAPALGALFAWRASLADARAPRALAIAGGALVVALLLALLAPPALGPAPLVGVSASRPAWPFAWLAPLQDAFGAPALLALPLAFALGALLLLRRADPSPRARVALVVALALAWSALTLWGLA